MKTEGLFHRGPRFAGWVLFIAVATLPVGRSAWAINDDGNERGAELAQRLAPKHVVAQEALEKYIEQVDKSIPQPALPEGKHYVRKVAVKDAKLLSRLRVWWITRKYRNRQLTAEDIAACCRQITATYRNEGYLSSYAFFGSLSPNGLLTLRAHEGTIGDIKFSGSLYSPEPVLRKRFAVGDDEVVYFDDLQYGAFKIARHMDRKTTMRLELDPKTGETDVNLLIKERPPVHITAEFDTYGSWYIGENRYRIVSLHNNLTGHDDSLQVKMQWADDSAHELLDIIYLLPIGNRLVWELYYMPYKAEDYIQPPLAGIHKRAWKTYTYLHWTMIENPKQTLVFDLGFVHKHIGWEKPLGTIQKTDYFSALLVGFDLDFRDAYGRTIIIDDYEMGIPGLFGAVEDDVYNDCSVQGANGKYQRNHLIVARRQKLFEGTELLAKAHWQWADSVLTGVNSFSVGGFYGVIDMRGYPRAQSYGENGYSVSAGLAMAPYFLPRSLKVPLSKGTFFQSLQFFALVDWAYVEKMQPPDTADYSPSDETYEPNDVDEDLSATLMSAVAGFQLTLPERLSVRLDVGWPLTKDDIAPSDGKDVHTWVRVSKTF